MHPVRKHGKVTKLSRLGAITAVLVAIAIVCILVATGKISLNFTSLTAPSITSYIYCVGTRASVPHNSTYYAPIYTNGSLGQWKQTTPYPYYRYGIGCLAYDNYIYCLPAGKAVPYNSTFDLRVTYYAPINANGIGNWTATTPYPIPLSEVVCTNPYNGRIYCIGDGDTVANFGNMPIINGTKAYYATISANGLTNWTATTPYPVPLFALRSSVYNGYVYSVGNGYHNATIGTSYENRTYYAQILQNGYLGQWKQTTPYPLPLFAATCSPYNGTFYCVGGQVENGTLTYYAHVLSNHSLEPWKLSAALPKHQAAVPCTINNYTGYIYCPGSGYGLLLNSTPVSANAVPVGVSVINRTATYFAKLSSTGGIGDWTLTTSYPVPLAYATCVVRKA